MADTSIPLSVRFEISCRRPGRGVYGMQPLSAGVVDTPHGPARVELSMLMDLPEDEPRPSQLAVMIRTADVPLGAAFHVDVTTLLEAFARAYFVERPDDRPLTESR